ncbi:MAG: VOC family protein [Candidatus Melainabacteria bacterium]|nr:VOC family protein [Candidatus Melainabacteria bacterium]
MSKAVKPIPEGYHTVTPHLVLSDCSKALKFYAAAFGATVTEEMCTDDKRIIHAEMKIGDSVIMMCDEFPEMGNKSPLTLGGSPQSLFLYCEDVDKSFKQAVDAGCEVTMPLGDMFWGDRYGRLKDPFGHEWALGMHIEDLTSEEIKKRGAEFMKKPASVAK